MHLSDRGRKSPIQQIHIFRSQPDGQTPVIFLHMRDGTGFGDRNHSRAAQNPGQGNLHRGGLMLLRNLHQHRITGKPPFREYGIPERRLLVLRQHLPEHARLDTQDGRSAAVALYYPASSSGAASPECRIPGRAAFFQPHSIFFPTEEAGTGKRHILCSKGKTGKSPSGNASEDSPAA